MADASQQVGGLASEHVHRPRQPAPRGADRAQPGGAVHAHRRVHDAGDLGAGRAGRSRRRGGAAGRHHRHFADTVPGPGRGLGRWVVGGRVDRLSPGPEVRRPPAAQPARPPRGRGQLGQGRPLPQRPRRPSSVRGTLCRRGPCAAPGGRRDRADALSALHRLGRGRVAGLVGAVRRRRRGRGRLLAGVRRPARPGRLWGPRRPAGYRAAGPDGSAPPARHPWAGRRSTR
jgi:hypothetical protein